MHNVNEYQAWTRSTVEYPEKDSLYYLGLALCGETGEAANKIKKVIRDDNGELTPERREAIAQELGDACWYIARLAESLNYQFSDILLKNVVKLRKRQRANTVHGDGDER